MSAFIDDSNNLIDPEEEVRKLQDLVKKLERQNQILRNKQNDQEQEDVYSKSENKEKLSTNKTPPKNVDSKQSLKESLQGLSLDEVELLDIDEPRSETEDEWLYTSPKRPSPSQKNVSPYKWVRQEFEDPSPEVETAKKSLLFKLEEVAYRVSRSASAGTLAGLGLTSFHTTTSSPALSSLNATLDRLAQNTERLHAANTNTKNSERTSQNSLRVHNDGGLSERLSPPSSHHNQSSPQSAHLGKPNFTIGSSTVPSIRPPLGLDDPVIQDNEEEEDDDDDGDVVDDPAQFRNKNSSRVNTGTFTRPKKHKPRVPPDTNDNLNRPHINHVGSADELEYDEVEQDYLRSSSPSNELTASMHKLTDVTDVQMLARMQEDSLRQSFSSHSSPKKSLSRSMNRSGLERSGLGLLETENSPSPHGSARSSPARNDNEGSMHVARSDNSLDAVSSPSTASSPADSPHSSNQHLDVRPHVAEHHRRSLPNLSSRMSQPSSLQHHGGSETILQSPSRDSPPRPATAATPARRQQRTPGSAARQASPGRPLSPQRTGIPTPRRGSGIPRPGASGLPVPRKSSIPGPSSVSALRRPSNGRAGTDESWKDGCF